MRKPPITLKKLTSKETLNNALGWILTIFVALAIVAIVFGGIKLLTADNRTVISNWQRGTLDETGNYAESKSSIYTKNAFVCDGLEITLDFDATVTYKVVFYDENGDMLSENGVTSEQTGAFKAESVPENAHYARVVVTPVDDNSITQLEVAQYARQIKISVAK